MLQHTASIPGSRNCPKKGPLPLGPEKVCAAEHQVKYRAIYHKIDIQSYNRIALLHLKPKRYVFPCGLSCTSDSEIDEICLKTVLQLLQDQIPSRCSTAATPPSFKAPALEGHPSQQGRPAWTVVSGVLSTGPCGELAPDCLAVGTRTRCS